MVKEQINTLRQLMLLQYYNAAEDKEQTAHEGQVRRYAVYAIHSWINPTVCKH